MKYIFSFPDIGEGIQEGKILEWYVKKGQKIKSGESIVKMETDKVVTDIPSPKEGIVVNQFGKVGDVVQVESPLIELDIEGIEGAEAVAVAKEKPLPAGEEFIDEKGFGVVGTLETAGKAAHLPSSGEGIKPVHTVDLISPKALATPVARAMARDYGIDINAVTGTGPAGRVKKEDIKRFAEGSSNKKAESTAAESPEVEIEDLTQIRKTIARKMIQSKQSAAHMTVIEEVEVSSLISLRKSQKEQFMKHGVRLTYLPFILKAVARALKDYPKMNAELDMENNRIIKKKYYHIGIAVDTDDGLVVPVIRNVDRLTVFEIAQKIMEISDKARDRKLTLEDMKDGTFTVTNYGSIGGTYGVPVINYPQVAILGVGRILKTPVVEDDQVVVGNVLPLSMSVDHRLIDGGVATRFILDILSTLKDPVSMLLGAPSQ